MAYKEKECPCGETFSPRHPAEKYCTPECATAYARKANNIRVARYRAKKTKEKEEQQ